MSSPFEIWLSLDLSSATGSVALHRKAQNSPAELMGEAIVGHGFEHSERLFSALETFLGAHRLNVQKIDRFLTSSGPGSYTGLRIALASWKAIAMATAKPMELLSGWEARGLAWLAETKRIPLPAELIVVTHISLEKYARARFVLEPSGLVLLEEGVVTASAFQSVPAPNVFFLQDDKCRPETFANVATTQAEVFPLRARHLGLALGRAVSRRTLVTAADYINATPDYFGSSF